jgi:threonine/homoserine/homoserine lactone efflux protein
MQKLKNIFVGFLISFIGSIPLGYLNVVGYEVYKKFGIEETIFYLFGVISIEFLVIYFTLLFANQLIANKKLIKFIEAFSIIFMFLLAYIFYSSASKEAENQLVLEKYVDYSPFVVGLILSCLNFIQIPFWTSWNLYLLNGNYIEISKSRKYFYVLGTVLGTFCGMLVLILSLDYVSNQTDFLAKYLMKIIIPLVFAGLGIFQAYKFYKKYYK